MRCTSKGSFLLNVIYIAWFVAIVSNCCWSKREWSNQLQTTHRKWNQRNELRIALAPHKKKLRKYSYVRENLTAVVRKYQSRSPTGKLIQFFILLEGIYIDEFETNNIHLAVVIYAIFVICQFKQMPFLKHPVNCILHVVHIDHSFNDDE